jgi:hypothetical protein
MSAYFAFVDRDRLTRPTIHSIGLPAELAGGKEPESMPHPDVVVLEAHPDGPMLYRYTADGVFAGDTWAESLENAKAQAEHEYGEALGEWQEVPEGVSDPATYAIEAAAGRTRP